MDRTVTIYRIVTKPIRVTILRTFTVKTMPKFPTLGQSKTF